jgi:hypothetical protein
VGDAETTAAAFPVGVGVGVGEATGGGVSVGGSDATGAPWENESVCPETTGLHSQGAQPLLDQISNAHSMFLSGFIQSW